MPDILITEFMDAAAVQRLSDHFDVLHDPGLADEPERCRRLMKECRALIVRNRTQVRGALLKAGGRLECIGRLGVGLDNIDLAVCNARGIVVYPATGANDRSVAEYVIAMVLVLLRGAYGASAEVAAGDWPRQHLIGREAGDRTLGLIGFGAIAREVAGRARAIGMTAIASDPHVPDADPAWAMAERATLDDLLRGSDAVSMHVPLTPATRGMIGSAELARMKPGAVLINAARGGVVDETALAAALADGHLAGAALDVFAAEPLDAHAGAAFSGLANVILTPHIAGVTEESNRRVSALIAERVATHLGRAHDTPD